MKITGTTNLVTGNVMPMFRPEMSWHMLSCPNKTARFMKSPGTIFAIIQDRRRKAG